MNFKSIISDTECGQINDVMKTINSEDEPPVLDRWMADAATLVKEDTGVNAVILVNHGYPEQDPVVIARFDDFEVFVSISDKPEIIDNPLVDVPMSDVMDWVKLNKELLLEYWRDELYPTSKMIKNIRKIETVG